MLDFSKFKKVSEDDKTVTMRHDKGHEMRILLKSLKPIEREQIKRIKMADGGKVQKFADGSEKPIEVEPVDPSDPDNQKPSDQSTQSVSPDHSTQITINAAPAPQTPSSAATTAPTPAQTPVSQAQPPQGPAAQFGQSPINVKVPQVPQSESNLNPDGTMNPGAVARNAQAGAGVQRDVNIAQGQGQAQIENAYNTEKAKIAQTDQDNFNKYIIAPTENFKQYIQSHPINPNAYQENMSSGKKATTALGLIFGGMAGKGQGNIVMDYLNKQIDRDIEGQKARMGQQQTVLGSYQHAYGDSNIANNLAKASMIDIYDHKAKELAAQLGTPQAWGNYLQFSADLAARKSKEIQDAAVNLNMLPGAQGGPLGSAQQPGRGGTASNSVTSSENGNDHLLTPDAQQKYDQLKYTHTKTPEQISAIQNQYQAAVQADKSIDQIKALWPQLRAKATASDWMAGKVDPHVVATLGGALGGGGAAMTGMGLPLAGGAAALGAGAGEATGHLIKGTLNGMSGQQGIQYHTAFDALTTQLGNALGEGITPTEKAEIARQFAPTWRDSEETANDKLEKLIKKIKTVAKTGALSDSGMTND
jgi:hypothetical protein